jgi:hypothetical protein
MNPRLRCLAIPYWCAHNGLVGGSSPPGPTTQSYATGDFLKVYERPRIGGDLCDGSFSETASLQSAGRFCAFFSGPEIPFPGKRRPREAETRFECRLRRRKSEHLVLPRPLGGHVGEARV